MIKKSKFFKKHPIKSLWRNLWYVRAAELKGWRRRRLNTFRVIILTLREFTRDKCQLRASALTYYTLLSIVPVFAMGFGVAKGFGLDKRLEVEILKKVGAYAGADNDIDTSFISGISIDYYLEATSEQTLQGGIAEVVVMVLNFSRKMLDNTKGGIIAGFGVLILFYTIMKMMINIERSFNDIWGVQKNRSLLRRLANFISFFVFCPIVLILSSSLSAFVISQGEAISGKLKVLGFISPAINFTIHYLPIIMIFSLFVFLYIALPNTRVKLVSAIVGALTATILFLAAQWIYLRFQIGVSKMGAIYGSFAALPLFLIWLQLSWTILLLGAEVSYSHQNVNSFEFESMDSEISTFDRRWITLGILRVCVQRFREEQQPATEDDLATALNVPTRLLKDTITKLVDAEILIEVIPKEAGPRDQAWQPAFDPAKLTIASILERLDRSSKIESLPIKNTEEMQALRGHMEQIVEDTHQSKGNINIDKV